MKVFVRQRPTGLWFAGGTVWSLERADSFDFESAVRAGEYCLNSAIREILDVVLTWDDPSWDMVLPSTPSESPRSMSF